MNISKSHPRAPQKHDEIILVAPRSLLMQESWHGLKTDGLSQFIQRIQEYKEFHPRSLMEQDEQFKQIVSYMIFKFEDSIFLMQRKASASEQRLKNKLSIGIGGHLKQEDIIGDEIITWIFREFHEEIRYTGSIKPTLLGFMNDDTNSVGRMHLGAVFLFEGDTNDIAIKSELKEGKLVPLKELNTYYDSMETWSQLITMYLSTIYAQ